MTTPSDIFGLHSLPQPSHITWWPYLVIAVIAMAAAVIVIVRRRQRTVPANIAAMRALEATRVLIARDDVQSFSSDVSTAVRDYVERAFGVRAPRRTTEELLADLMTDSSPVATHRDELGVFLEYCDLAKYARFALSRSQMTGMLDSAELFVRSTAGGAS